MMFPLHIKFERSRRLSLGVLAGMLCLIFSFRLGWSQSVLAASASPVRYVIQLNSAGDLSALSGVTLQFKREFDFSQAPEFQNIYSFEAMAPIGAMRAALAGHYRYLEAAHDVQTQAVVTNDPGYTGNPMNIDKQWSLPIAGFTSAWATTTGSFANVVAVIDTGIDATHEDLTGVNYAPGFDFIGNQAIAPKTNSDDNGHGTLVAGVLGATPNNGVGVVGSNWKITLMPLKALDSSGKGDAATIAEAIAWATDHGANFINLSIGGIGFAHDTTLADAITYAFDKNVLVVAAAGNDMAATGTNLDQQPVYPICDDNNENMVLGVAATDQNDLKADFSNYGKNCIDVSAPGKRILSTINYDPLTRKHSPNSYAYASGTSLAVPLVVGQAALIRALYPESSNVQIRDRIMATAQNIDTSNLSQCGGGSCKGLLGTGRIDVVKSLQEKISSDAPEEGAIVKAVDNGAIYQISGGQKRLISSYVLYQLFAGAVPKLVYPQQLVGYPDGPYVTPADGTLFKLDSSPTVYTIQQGQKRPITLQVFKQRGYSFSSVVTLSYPEVSSWTVGPFLSPLEGSLVRSPNKPDLYWVVNGAMHLLNAAFYQQRGLQEFPIVIMPEKDLTNYSQGDDYVL